MAPLTPEQCLQRLRVIYRDAFKCQPENDEAVMCWAESPYLWATHQIRFRNWSFMATEAVVRQCRIYRKRARQAVENAK